MRFLEHSNIGVRPMACVCHTTSGHANARNSNSWLSPCLHCGCSCDSKGQYKTGNRVAALRTIGQK